MMMMMMHRIESKEAITLYQHQTTKETWGIDPGSNIKVSSLRVQRNNNDQLQKRGVRPLFVRHWLKKYINGRRLLSTAAAAAVVE